MKAEERRGQERLLGIWRKFLASINEVGPESESREDLESFGLVKDYCLDRIEAIEDRLERDRLNRRRKTHAIRDRITAAADDQSRLPRNGLQGKVNLSHNRLASGADNG